MNRKENDFRKWIEAGYRDYGKDPWFFLRELAQNSRDAGASKINVTIGYSPGKEESIIFEDNGTGMSYKHAGRYLFRLYASSKGGQKHAAGMFGIGFWTVLKFEPSSLVIESRCEKWNQAWGVEVDSDLNTRRIDGTLSARGTRITLSRSPRETSKEDFSRLVRTALEQYCCYLRRNNRAADPLPVFFAGECINRDMELPGPVSLSFKKGSVEGAVGLGPEPSVRLYARGLPVWEGRSLEELSHTPPAAGGTKAPDMEVAHGLAPVFLLNGNHLEVNISRRRVMDNRNLETVRRAAERALAQLVEMAADYVSPRTFSRRVLDLLRKGWTAATRSFIRILMVGLLVLVPLEILLLTSLSKCPAGKSTVNYVSIKADTPYYPGASVREVGESKPLALTYEPAVNVWFKLFTADRYTNRRGFLQSGNGELSGTPFPSVDCKRYPISVKLETRESGKVYLPQANPSTTAGYLISPGSITFNGANLTPDAVRFLPAGDVVVTIPHEGTLRYLCCQSNRRFPLASEMREWFTRLPQTFRLPQGVENKLTEMEESFETGEGEVTVHDKVDNVLRLTASLLKYDDSSATAERYLRSYKNEMEASDAGGTDWFRRVVGIGLGDCDILNGVTVLFLRKIGVPARLVIGLVGKSGRILPVLHAWTEYYDQRDHRWHIVDATTTTPAAARGTDVDEEKDAPFRFPTHRITMSTPAMYALAVALFLLLCLFILFLIRLSRHKKNRRLLSSMHTRVQENLAGMVLHDLLHPGAWGHGSGFRRFEIIPTITGEYISLSEALRLAGRRRLFTLNPSHRLASSLVRECRRFCLRPRLAVLDAGNAAFARVVKLLPGAIHLEKVLALKPLTGEKIAEPPLRNLLNAVNGVLKKLYPGIPSCMISPGLTSGDFLDADLSLLPERPFREVGIPHRFIAVNPGSERVKRLAGLFLKNPPVAQYRLIQAVVKESNLVPQPAGRVLEKVSRFLLKDGNR
jgi:hypothetical protein